MPYLGDGSPEGTEMELTQALSLGAHRQVRGQGKATDTVALLSAEDGCWVGRPWVCGASSLHRRVERAGKSSWRRRRISRVLRTSGLN